MKLLKNALFFIFLLVNFAANAQNNLQDTICLDASRVARIADTIAYLRHFERYSNACDSALFECWNFSKTMQESNYYLTIQRNSAVQGGELLAKQLEQQKAISEQWRTAASDMDIKIQKAKRRGKMWGALFGGAAGAGLLSGILIGLLK